MYVGRKSRTASGTVLQKNGLVGGKLYALRSTTPGFTNEDNFTTAGASITAEWVEIPNANNLSGAQLEAAADALPGGPAFGFIRTEDGSFDKNTPTQDYYFVITGSGGQNQLGRMYHLHWSNPANPLSPVTLTMLFNSDTTAGDIAVSPDNMDNNGKRVMVCEDGTTQSRAAMTSRGRDGCIWSFDTRRAPAHPRRDAGDEEDSGGTRSARARSEQPTCNGRCVGNHGHPRRHRVLRSRPLARQRPGPRPDRCARRHRGKRPGAHHASRRRPR